MKRWAQNNIHSETWETAIESMTCTIRKNNSISLITPCSQVHTAQEERLVSKALIDRAKALVAVLEAEPPGAKPAPAGAHSMGELTRPDHIDKEAVFGVFMHCAGKTVVADNSYEYWGGEFKQRLPSACHQPILLSPPHA